MGETMPAGAARPPGRVLHWLLWLSAPLWAVPFLLAQAMRLCGEGLLAMVEDQRGRPAACPAPVAWLLGLPGLALFPLAVGLRGLLHLIHGLGRFVLRRPGAGEARGPEGAAGARRRFPRGEAGGALTLLVGFLVLPLVPLGLAVGLVVWLARSVLWKLLVPEFARALRAAPGPREERMVLFVGLRYLFSARQTALHSATHYFAAAGIALGVCALIVVLAVMSGFDREVRERIVGTNAHVIVLRFGQEGVARPDSLARVIAGHPETVATAPFVFGKAMVSAGGGADGAFIKGVDWEAEREVTSIARYAGDPPGDPGLAAAPGKLPGMLLGRQIVETLGLYTGDEVILVSPAETRRTPLGFIPRMRRFELIGAFESGMYEYDASLAIIDLAEARSFFGLSEDRVTGIEVRIADMNRAPEVGEELVARLGGFPYRANNWIELNANLFSWMRTEKRVMFVILTMIILVAGFSIASTLIMLVTEKRREIGILMSMGATRAGVLRIFVLEGWVIALAGTALGTGLGLGLCHALERYKFIRLPADIYFIDTLPVRVEWGDIGAIIAAVLLIAALATLYPAWKASRLDPVEAIRAE